MKAMKLTGIRQMEMMEIPEPVISGPKDVKIKMSVVGVCGSDIHYYTNGRIGSQVVRYPFAVGHEGAGIVVETGVGVSHVKKGDKIAIEPAMPCWKCDQCLSGRYHTCRNLKYLGCPGQAEGCLTEYIVMPEESCFSLHGHLNTDHGTISEPLSIGIYSVKKAGNIKNTSVGILGFGPIGMSVMLAAKAEGAGSFLVTDKINERLSIATKEGAEFIKNPLTTDVVDFAKSKFPLGLDIVFECCGQQEAVDQAVEILKPGGKLIVVGIPEFDRWSLSADNTRRKEITMQFIRRQVDCVRLSLDMMESGKINTGRMITHRFPFSRTKEAFDLVAGYTDGVMKAIIDF
ncbi:MAG: alcohol dehydrogenase catalytic domain-containing protein [Bacteroidota bacterium]|nr:alcohol dehydrogenase catalytic domain-containing protein [Bacteroidota bacterium]